MKIYKIFLLVYKQLHYLPSINSLVTYKSLSDWSPVDLLGERLHFFFTLQPRNFFPVVVLGPGNLATNNFCTYFAFIHVSLIVL